MSLLEFRCKSMVYKDFRHGTLLPAQWERRVVMGSRFLTIMAIVGALAGSLLMFGLGLISMVEACRHVFVAAAELGLRALFRPTPPEAATRWRRHNRPVRAQVV
jgi:hypothetical protein